MKFIDLCLIGLNISHIKVPGATKWPSTHTLNTAVRVKRFGFVCFFCLTSCDLTPRRFQVIVCGNLSDRDQHPVVSVPDRRDVDPVRFCPLRRARGLHGNRAGSGRRALSHLHDNCIRSAHHNGAGWALGEAKRLIGWALMWLCDVMASDWMGFRNNFGHISCGAAGGGDAETFLNLKTSRLEMIRLVFHVQTPEIKPVRRSEPLRFCRCHCECQAARFLTDLYSPTETLLLQEIRADKERSSYFSLHLHKL